jgi:hypothetical protein
MTKNANCQICGDTNPDNFYYGKKSICKKCKIKSMKKVEKDDISDDESNNEDLSERVINLEKTIYGMLEIIENTNFSLKDKVLESETRIQNLEEIVNSQNKTIKDLYQLLNNQQNIIENLNKIFG